MVFKFFDYDFLIDHWELAYNSVKRYMSNLFIRQFEDSFKENWDLKSMCNYATGESITYGEMACEISKMHLLFKLFDIKQDDKIAIVGPNSQEMAITFISVITYGAVAVPILEDSHPDVIEDIINHSEAQLLFVSDMDWKRIHGEKIPNVKAVFSLSEVNGMRLLQGSRVNIMEELRSLIGQTFPDGVRKEDVCYTDMDDDLPTVIIYTSGTSGFTKGVMLSGKNFCSNIDFLRKTNSWRKGYKGISILPLAHVYALINDLFLPLIVGACIIYLYKVPSLKLILTAMEKTRPEWISLVPLFFEGIHKKYVVPYFKKRSNRILFKLPLISIYMRKRLKNRLIEILGGNLKRLFMGGAGLNRDVEAFFREIDFPFTIGYGMTECSPLITMSYKHPKVFSVGKPLDNVRIKIASSDPMSVPGEILVKGNNVMKGYFKNDEATRNTFTEDGWFKTGDVGILDKEGYLYLKGRTKNMILTSSGQNVYPEEIEVKLNSDPLVAESLVILRDGKRLVALIYPNYQLIGEDVDPHKLAEMMESVRLKTNHNLASYEYLNVVEIVPEPFEKTAKKSIKRFLYQ